MHIIVAGGGGVGFEVARNLSEKNMDVVVIEKNPEKAARLGETLDVMVINDNGANAIVLERAGIKNADMLIAVTEVDEINIIACMLAKRYAVPITIARIRNTDYAQSSKILSQEHLGIDIVINPERAAANEISRILHFPDASKIDYFNQGKVMMLALHIDKEADITGQPLYKLSLPNGCIIVGIGNDEDKFIIPGGRDVINPGEKIYLLGSAHVLKDISWLLHHEQTRVRQVAILGGGMIGLQLARLLEESKRNFSIKLVEKCEERCRQLSSELSRTLVLQGDASELRFFQEEEMEWADAVVAVTGDDRTNIIAGLLAKQFNVKKVICEVINQQYLPVYNRLGIDSVINPRLVAAAQIMRYTRSKDVVDLAILQNEKAEVVELVLSDTSRVVNKKISKINFPRGMLIGTIVRNEEIIIPHGDTKLLPGDHLVIFALPEVSSIMDRYFASGREKENGVFGRLIPSAEE